MSSAALTTTIDQAMSTDAELIAASREGDRDAFGRIVRKYQAMITGLIYAACGDIHRSEDLAQETFISAWKGLADLREPAKLAGWLCQIARHRLLDQQRGAVREKNRLSDAFEHAEIKAEPSPQAQLLSREESELLWRTLAEIPQPYRETLVLYYRQGQSAADVAQAMETTEAAVRQRLSRGREMLRDQVAQMLERDLARSAPSTAFTVAVVAALPALAVNSARAATVGAVTKGAASTGVLMTLGMWIGPVIGLAGGVFGTIASIRASQTPRERRFMIRTSIVTWIFVMVAMAVLFWSISLGNKPGWHKSTSVVIQIAFWVVYMLMLAGMIVVMNRKHRRLRRDEGLPDFATGSVKMSPALRAWAIIGSTVGAVAWMFAMALTAHDTATAAILALVVNVLIGVAIYRLPDASNAALMHYILIHFALIGLLTAIVVNLRFHVWIAAMGHISLAEARTRVPFWAINALLGVIWVGIEASMIVSFKVQSRRGDGLT